MRTGGALGGGEAATARRAGGRDDERALLAVPPAPPLRVRERNEAPVPTGASDGEGGGEGGGGEPDTTRSIGKSLVSTSLAALALPPIGPPSFVAAVSPEATAASSRGVVSC